MGKSFPNKRVCPMSLPVRRFAVPRHPRFAEADLPELLLWNSGKKDSKKHHGSGVRMH